MTAPIIGFPRGAGPMMVAYAQETGIDALGVDTQTPAAFARGVVPAGMALQGNLDPQLSSSAESRWRSRCVTRLQAFGGGPHIFNLGHGITPEASAGECRRAGAAGERRRVSAVPLETPSPKPEDRPGLRVMTSRRVAIILFNLGGPDSLKAVRPFLFNLFNDKAIIGVASRCAFSWRN